MARIDINFELVRQKTTELNQLIENELVLNTNERYEQAEYLASGLEGTGAEIIKTTIRLEKENMKNLVSFLTNMLSFIQDSADAFEDVDQNYEEIIRKFL